MNRIILFKLTLKHRTNRNRKIIFKQPAKPTKKSERGVTMRKMTQWSMMSKHASSQVWQSRSNRVLVCLIYKLLQHQADEREDFEA